MENVEDIEPLFCLELMLEDDSLKKSDEVAFLENSLLYPLEKNLEILQASASFFPFIWCNYKQAYRNISVDAASNQIDIRPVMPHHLLEDITFQKFLEEHTNEMLMVARLGYEIHFGCVDNIKNVEQKIIDWFNHHIYDTTVIIDLHDFYPHSKTRRIQTYNAMIVPNTSKKGKARVYWKKGHLHHLQS
jgi:hypothetical protein